MGGHMTGKRRLAIIGTSDIAMFHVDAAREAGFSVDHVAARLQSKTVADFATRHGIAHAWQDPHELIAASDKWDALVIASTTESVLGLLRAGVATGKPILVEKPVATHSSELEGLDLRNPLVLVAYNRRYYASVGAAREFVASGSPALIHCEIPESVRRDEDGRLITAPVRLNSVHVFDLLNFLLPGLSIVDARLIEPGRPDNGGFMTCVSSRGDLCSISTNWNAPANFSLTIDRDGERFELRPLEIATVYRGMEVIEPSQEIPIRRYVPQAVKKIVPPDHEVKFKPGFVDQARALRDVLDGKSSPIAASLTDARVALQFAERMLGLMN
jgi:predicted dehydrogenase